MKLVVLGLAVYGGYKLWSQFSRGAKAELYPPDRRIYERSELTVTELSVGSDDPVAQARAILADSDARTELPRDAPGIERRQSQDTVEP